MSLSERLKRIAVELAEIRGDKDFRDTIEMPDPTCGTEAD
jgi:hypothetical protein